MRCLVHGSGVCLGWFWIPDLMSVRIILTYAIYYTIRDIINLSNLSSKLAAAGPLAMYGHPFRAFTGEMGMTLALLIILIDKLIGLECR